jgi:organic hydroperoxide reductase OsmC/OhrA
MKPLPHEYDVTITTEHEGPAEIRSFGLTTLMSAPPAEFGGPGNLWSPETLLVAAVADCFIQTFKAIASISKLGWSAIFCDAKGTVDRAQDGVRFTRVSLHVRLDLASGTQPDSARRVLEKTERGCLISNSLKCKPEVAYDIAFEEAFAPASH